MTAAARKQRSRFERCPCCDGSGLALNMAGEPDTCRECDGDGQVLAHDERGRFIPYPKDEAEK